ncbi:MAG: Gfo/Idh/MocA family oxidoreductase [Kiritimatiellae bacterium]|nr:Gfo/Idh/MocA family oxidoreductase [Kiritimatiellia bacterium]
MKKRSKRIRVGVIGVGRGMTFARAAKRVGLDLVAICDTWEDKLQKVGSQMNVTTYTDYDKFLEHDMDAVVLANYFHQHAPFAIKALKAGKHVLSECAACHTMSEGVALARAVEKSNKIYMLAENYPYMVFNQEMRRLYRKGTIGEFKYGEGEYVHPFSAEQALGLSPGFDHWRNWIPSTYYCTHSIAPVMYITDTRPVKVNAFVVPYDYNDSNMIRSASLSDVTAMIALRMDNDAVVKSLHGQLHGHGNFVRIHGSKGLMENCRHGDKLRLRIYRERFEKKKNEPEEIVYKPDFPSHHKDATKAGHSGGDFWTNFHFSQAIKTGKQPYLDVYKAIDMSIVGIQAYRSALADGVPMDLPDFRKESVRKKYVNDDWTADPEKKKKGQPSSSIRGKIKLTNKAKALAKKVWAKKMRGK